MGKFFLHAKNIPSDIIEKAFKGDFGKEVQSSVRRSRPLNARELENIIADNGLTSAAQNPLLTKKQMMQISFLEDDLMLNPALMLDTRMKAKFLQTLSKTGKQIAYNVGYQKPKEAHYMLKNARAKGRGDMFDTLFETWEWSLEELVICVQELDR